VPEVVVASFNAHWGRGPRSHDFEPFDLVGACRRLAADVLVLQEAWAPDDGPAQTDQVADSLGYEIAATVPMARISFDPEPAIDARGGDPADGGEGSWNLALLSRFPVRGCEVVGLPQLPPDPVSRSLLIADLDLDGVPLTVCGAHLPHLEFGAPLIAPHLRRALPATDQPAVLAGDMNMWGWTIDAMTPAGWRRVVRGRTYPAHRPLAGIDHVLVTPKVEDLFGEVVALDGSDHLPVRAVVAVN
jgi:endonuclease/exonuclease/phosphatase family metal-dependent hydrolase